MKLIKAFLLSASLVLGTAHGALSELVVATNVAGGMKVAGDEIPDILAMLSCHARSG